MTTKKDLKKQIEGLMDLVQHLNKSREELTEKLDKEINTSNTYLNRYNECKKNLEKSEKVLDDLFAETHVKNVYINEKKRTTVVEFGNGKKVTVKCAKNVKFDKYAAVAYALAEQLFTNNSSFKRVVDRATRK